MNKISNITKTKNVYVDNKVRNNVYVDVEDIKIINDANDKHKAIGEMLASKLNKPDNVKLYIKLSYLNSTTSLFEWSAIALEAYKEGKTTDVGGYFYGIVRNLGKLR